MSSQDLPTLSYLGWQLPWRPQTTYDCERLVQWIRHSQEFGPPLTHWPLVPRLTCCCTRFHLNTVQTKQCTRRDKQSGGAVVAPMHKTLLSVLSFDMGVMWLHWLVKGWELKFPALPCMSCTVTYLWTADAAAELCRELSRGLWRDLISKVTAQYESSDHENHLLQRKY